MSIDAEQADVLTQAEVFAARAYRSNPPGLLDAKEVSDEFLDSLMAQDVDLSNVDPTYWSGVGAALGLDDDELGDWSEKIRACCSGELS